MLVKYLHFQEFYQKQVFLILHNSLVYLKIIYNQNT